MINLVDRLRKVFQERRYGAGSDYHPDFDLFDAAADEIEKLRRRVVVLEEMIKCPSGPLSKETP